MTTQIASGNQGRESGTVDDGPTSTGSRTTRVLGLLTLAGFGLLMLFGLVLSPADSNQGDAVRIMYIHVPSATLAYTGCFLATLGSAM